MFIYFLCIQPCSVGMAYDHENIYEYSILSAQNLCDDHIEALDQGSSQNRQYKFYIHPYSSPSFKNNITFQKPSYLNVTMETVYVTNAYASFNPFVTNLSGCISTTSPFSVMIPVVNTSEIKFPICFGGKFVTHKTCFPRRYSLVYNLVI